MSQHRSSAVLLAILAACPAGLAAQQRMPSDVLHDVMAARIANPRWTPQEVEANTKHLVPQARVQNLSAEEEVALGLVYVFTFDGVSARPILARHLNRTDIAGRAAWQSMQMLDFFGAGDTALVTRRTAEYRRRFPVVPEDGEYTYQMTNVLANARMRSGDHAGAVALVLEDVANLPIDAPVRSFQLIGIYFESFRATGRADTALALMKRHRDALRSRFAGGMSATPPTQEVEHRSGVLHFFFVDALDGDVAISAEDAVRVRVQRLIARMDQLIARAEQGGN